MNVDPQVYVIVLAFLAGLLIGIYIPLICVKLYNAVGSSLGEICDDEEEDQNDR